MENIFQLPYRLGRVLGIPVGDLCENARIIPVSPGRFDFHLLGCLFDLLYQFLDAMDL
jgi:hypothetical protein